jgi:hypothetical protein
VREEDEQNKTLLDLSEQILALTKELHQSTGAGALPDRCRERSSGQA